MANTSAYGSMATGMAIGQQTGKDYTNELNQVVTGTINKVIKGAAEKQAVMQKKFDNVMQQFEEVSMIPTVTAEERTQIQPIINSTSLEVQDFARALVDDPSNLEAQAGYNAGIAKMNRITQAQTEKYKNNANAARIHQTNSYSSGQDPNELNHAKEIVAGAKRDFNSDGYETYVMDDGTTYDNDPNTKFPAPPNVAEEYKEGHAKILASWNNTVTNNKSLKQLQDASESFDIDGNANTLYNDIMASGPNGAAPNYNQKMDMLFGDISGDGQNISFGNMFINGKLDQQYYTDLNGDELEFNGKKISDFPLASSIKAPEFYGITEEDLEKVVTREQALEGVLRDRNSNDANLRNFTKFYAKTTSDGLEDKKLKQGVKEGKVLLGDEDMAMLGTGRKTVYFNTPAEGQIAKKELYTDMFIDKALYNDLNDPSGNSNEIVDLFNSSNLNVEIVEDKEGNTLYMTGDDEKGTAKYYNPNNNSEMSAFKTFVKQNTKGMFTDLGNLNEDPKTWGLIRNVYETSEGPKIDISGEPKDKKTPEKNSILNSPVSENNNMNSNVNNTNTNTNTNNNPTSSGVLVNNEKKKEPFDFNNTGDFNFTSVQ